MTGVGRILRTAPGWLAAATDSQILLCDLRRSTIRRLDVSLVQLTHLAIKPDDFGLALIQERDRIGRLTPSSRWVWKHELRFPVEDLAIGPRGFAAITTNGGQFQVFDPTGESTVGFTFDPTDAPLLIEAPEGSPGDVVWLSLARRDQWLRGHALGGQVLWERPLPWEGWSLSRLGHLALVAAADGSALSCDGSGAFHGQGGPSARLQRRLLPHRRWRADPDLAARRSPDRCDPRWTGAMAVGRRPNSGTARRRHNGRCRPARQIARLVPSRAGHRPGVTIVWIRTAVTDQPHRSSSSSNRGRSGCCARSQLAWWIRRMIRSIFG